MNFIKTHWFGLLISIFVLFYMLVSTLVLIAPRKDSELRGFTACTEVFALEVKACDGSKCVLKKIVSNSWCDIKVVCSGFADWVSGKQPRPWSNYLFDLEYEEEVEEDMDEGLQEFYETNPNLIYDIEELKRLNEELLREQK